MTGEEIQVAAQALEVLQAEVKALGEDQLLAVQDDPGDPNRQLARLRGDRLLDSRVVGRRSQRLGSDLFLADELTLQVLHGPGEPRISRIETLGRWERRDDGGIDGEFGAARFVHHLEQDQIDARSGGATTDDPQGDVEGDGHQEAPFVSASVPALISSEAG